VNLKLTAVVVSVLVGSSCSSSSAPSTAPWIAPPLTTSPSSEAPESTATETHHVTTQVALVTAELRDELVVMSVPGGKVLRRIPVAHDPKTVASAPGGPVAVVSPGSGTVTVFGRGLQRVAVFRHFRSPQLATVTADGEYLLVTDADAGTLTSIELADMRIVGHVAVGAGAHHLATSPDRRRAWVALGETADTLVIVDITDPRHMRVVRRLHPEVAAHDLAFSPGGQTVWVSSASEPYVSVYSAASGRLIDTIPAGRAPQHVVFAAGRAYITSGYGSSIEMVAATTRRVLRRAELPYGSFNLASTGPWLVVTSVLNGEVTVLRASTLRRGAETKVATAARSVAVLSR
jgi:DNA-binding beta-propeller fold protein YncE